MKDCYSIVIYKGKLYLNLQIFFPNTFSFVTCDTDVWKIPFPWLLLFSRPLFLHICLVLVDSKSEGSTVTCSGYEYSALEVRSLDFIVQSRIIGWKHLITHTNLTANNKFPKQIPWHKFINWLAFYRQARQEWYVKKAVSFASISVQFLRGTLTMLCSNFIRE